MKNLLPFLLLIVPVFGYSQVKKVTVDIAVYYQGIDYDVRYTVDTSVVTIKGFPATVDIFNGDQLYYSGLATFYPKERRSTRQDLDDINLVKTAITLKKKT